MSGPSEPCRPRVIVITGERGVGKSVVCGKLAALLRARGVEAGGVLTEREPAGDERVAVDLATGERRSFGRHEHNTGAAASGTEGPGAPSPAVAPGAVADPLTPGWQYADDIFAWGNRVFERTHGRAVLMVDELGPVEILGGRGWAQALEYLQTGDHNTAVVVCRPSLLAELTRLLRRAPDSVYEVTLETRDGMPAAVAAEIVGS